MDQRHADIRMDVQHVMESSARIFKEHDGAKLNAPEVCKTRAG